MSVLLNKIRSLNHDVAEVLEKADLRTDSDIRSLTREELNELFPGPEKLKLRRNIFDMIHRPRPVNELIRELKEFIPHESFRAALTNNGVLVEYLHLLKDIKTQVDNIQDFINAHIDLLEESSNDQPDQESDKGSLSGNSTSNTSSQMLLYNGPTGDHSQGAQGTSVASGSVEHHTRATGGHARGFQMTCQVVVTGKTFDAHKQLLEKVRDRFKDQFQFVENSVDHQVTIVFCPITTRIGSDVDAAMSCVTDDKPFILVLMHHAREAKPTTSVRTWSSSREAVLYVDVFYHETAHGLLTCRQNNLAVSNIRNKLLEYGTPRCQDTSGNAQGVGADSGRTGSWDGSGGNDRGSDNQSSSSSGGFLGLFRSNRYS